MRFKVIILACITSILSCKEREHKLDILPPSFKGKQFTVTTRSGLNLRENAGIESRSLGVLPNNTEGLVVDNQSQLLQIQKAPGYWLKVNTKGKTGWVFSGFVKLSDPQSTPIPISGEPERALREIEFYEPHAEKEIKPIVKKTAKLGAFQITAANFPGHSMSYCLGTKYVDKVEIKDTHTGKTYVASDDHEELFALNEPLPNMMVTGISALCGCGEIFASKFYFLGKNHAFHTPWPLKKTAMICGDSAYPGIEMRLDKSLGTLIVQEDNPKCYFDSRDDSKKPSIKNRRYIVITWQSNDFSSKSYEEKEMPSAMAKTWAASEVVNLDYKFAYEKDSKF